MVGWLNLSPLLFTHEGRANGAFVRVTFHPDGWGVCVCVPSLPEGPWGALLEEAVEAAGAEVTDDDGEGPCVADEVRPAQRGRRQGPPVGGG